MKRNISRLFCAALCAAMLTGAAFAESERDTSVEYAPVDTKTHDKIEETWDYPLDEDGERTSGTYVGTETTSGAHSFVDGKCALCGYVQNKEDAEKEGEENGDAAPEGRKDEAAAPVIRVVPAAEAVHGVSVDQSLDAVATMKAVFESLDPDTEVRLADIEELFNAGDAAALARLPAKEQALVLLWALGLDVNEPLSDEAQAVLAAIMAHTTPDDLMKAMPSETFRIDGQDVECYVITLAFNSASGEVLEHYAFRKDDNIFARLTIEE